MTFFTPLLVMICAAALSLSVCADADAATISAVPVHDNDSFADVPYAAVIAHAPDSAWRSVPPENLVRITTSKGEVWIELAPEFAPAHAARIRELAASGWLDWKVFHRVINGFMAQGGGAIDNPNISAPFTPLPAEFTLRRDPDTVIVTEIQDRVVNSRSNRTSARAGFWNGFPVGAQPAALAGISIDGRVESWLLHCQGAAAMARTSDPDSAIAQFYIVNGNAEHLNTQYTVWGKVRAGMDVVHALHDGVIGENPGFQPDIIEDFELASAIDDNERPTIEVMDTHSPSFAAYLEALAASQQNDRLPDICEIDVPLRILD